MQKFCSKNEMRKHTEIWSIDEITRRAWGETLAIRFLQRLAINTRVDFQFLLETVDKGITGE